MQSVNFNLNIFILTLSHPFHYELNQQQEQINKTKKKLYEGFDC